MLQNQIEIGLTDSSPWLLDVEALRDRAEREGYLFFRGLLPVESIVVLRQQMLQALDSVGWLSKSHPLTDGVISRDVVASADPALADFCGGAIPPEVYRAVQKLENFHALAHHPALLGLFARLFDSPVLVHPRNIARLVVPDAPGHAPTPAHQDFIHIQGTRDVWTCWVPIGHCPFEVGGLAVLPGSHRGGILRGHEGLGAGRWEIETCEQTPRYVTDVFDAGDVLAFPSLTVHQAVASSRRDRVRLSCDFRYQRLDEPITPESLRVHCDVLDWEEVYADWTGHESLRYYWRQYPLNKTAFDHQVKWQSENICG